MKNKIISCNPINNFTYQNEIMNYSFILSNNKELNNLKIKIKGKDPINNIESNININNIIKIENGEDMSKMIIGRALKNNDELIKDEKKEIEFAKKYQILSKNTSLFAEILNEDNQQSKLIKVNLNEYIPRIADKKLHYIPSRHKKRLADRGKPRPIEPRMVLMMAKCDYNFYSDYTFGGDIFDDNSEYKESIPEKHKKKEINRPKPSLASPSSNKKNEIKDDITRIIMSQDIIEGFWEENNDTKKLVSIISSDKFNKIKNKVNTLYKGPNEIKLIYTILVIYYLNTKCSARLDEFRLIINKANKYLEKNGIKYENIVTGI